MRALAFIVRQRGPLDMASGIREIVVECMGRTAVASHQYEPVLTVTTLS
jgi:hypothetical protein